MAEEITFTGAIIEKPDKIMGYNGKLYVDSDIVDRMTAGNNGSKRIIVSISETIEWHAAFISSGKGEYFIIVNKERVKALQKNEVDINQVHVTLLPDESEYGMPMPIELGELLAMDSEVDAYFHALTPGKMRALMYIIAKPKREETRLKKAVGITEYLKEVRGKLDFAEMGVWLKER